MKGIVKSKKKRVTFSCVYSREKKGLFPPKLAFVKAAIKFSEQEQIWKANGNTWNHTSALFLFLWCDQKCSNCTDSDTYEVFEFAVTERLYRDVSYYF